MKTRITYKFIRKSTPNKEGIYPIYMRAFLHGKKVELATTVQIPLTDWSDTHQRVKKRNKQHLRHNTILEAFDKKPSNVSSTTLSTKTPRSPYNNSKITCSPTDAQPKALPTISCTTSPTTNPVYDPNHGGVINHKSPKCSNLKPPSPLPT